MILRDVRLSGRTPAKSFEPEDRKNEVTIKRTNDRKTNCGLAALQRRNFYRCSCLWLQSHIALIFLLLIPSMSLSAMWGEKSGGSFVCSLTVRYPLVSSAALKQLAHLGIDVVFRAPLYSVVKANAPVHSGEEALFLRDFYRKGEIFRKWLGTFPIRPSKKEYVFREYLELKSPIR